MRIHVFLHSRSTEEIARQLAILGADVKTLIRQGAKLMTQQDDLQVALDAANKKLDALSAPVAALAAEVTALTASLQAHPAAPDLGPQISAATAIGAKADALATALGAIPKAA